MKTKIMQLGVFVLIACFCFAASDVNGAVLFKGDGSDEPGFVPPKMGEPPPPPPAQVSSAETFVPYPGPPVTPQARSEKKKPPKPPVMFTKIKSDKGVIDWATRPNDINNLVKAMKGMIDVDYSINVKGFDEISTDPEQNPILYRSGHFHFSLSKKVRERLRKFMLNGGMVVFNTGMGSKPFYDSAKKELGKIFPEAPVKRIDPDHPILHSYYDIGRVEYRDGVRAAGYTSNQPWIEGVEINCRLVAVISRWGMAVGWDELKDKSIQAYSTESARKLGINIMSYATAERAWAKNMAKAMRYVDNRDELKSSTMNLVQVKYDGQWKTRHAGLSLLLQQFNQQTGIPVKFGRQELELTDARIFDAPLLFMTGHEDFELGKREVANLRRYLMNGGVLFAEACCGREAFDQAFRREMRKVLPGSKLNPLSSSSMVYRLPNRLGELETTPALEAKRKGDPDMKPELLAAKLDGNIAVFYSPFALQGGWELSQDPYSRGYANAASLQLGKNILMYTLIQ